jgi:hypothetical protein
VRTLMSPKAVHCSAEGAKVRVGHQVMEPCRDVAMTCQPALDFHLSL